MTARLPGYGGRVTDWSVALLRGADEAATRVRGPDAVEVLLPLTGDPDEPWCDLFNEAELPVAEVLDATPLGAVVLDVEATQDFILLGVRSDIGQQLLWRVLEWVKETVQTANVRRTVLDGHHNKVDSLVDAWWAEQPTR